MNFADITVVFSQSLPHTATGPVILIPIQSFVPYHAYMYILSPIVDVYSLQTLVLLSIDNKMPQRLLLQHFDLSSVNRYPIGAPSFRMVLIQLTLLGISVCIAICKPLLNCMIFFIIILLCPFSHQEDQTKFFKPKELNLLSRGIESLSSQLFAAQFLLASRSLAAAIRYLRILNLFDWDPIV